jgi:lipopolysaccharide transport system permease protein
METVLRPPSFSIGRLRHALAMLPRYSDLFIVLTAHRIKVRYKQSLLGPIWALLQPAAMMIVFVAVMSVIGRNPGGTYPYAVFAYAGVLPWTMFASAIASGATALVTHTALVTRVAFPRELLPLSYVTVALFDLLVASSVLAGLLIYFSLPVTTAIVWVVPIVVLLALFATAVSLTLSAVNVRWRDVSVGLPLLLQIWMFASPVIYPLSAVPTRWRPFYDLNPMAGIVDGFRGAVLEGRAPDPSAFSTAAIVTVLLAALAYLGFKHVDATLADHV